MDYKMPDLTRIGGYNRIQVPPIVIEAEDKESLIKIVEKIIRKMIEISPWHRWPLEAPKKKFLSEEKINQLARDFIRNREICLKPACLVLTMKNGRISLNVSNWINRGNRGDPRPLGDIKHLERLMNDTKTEIRDIARMEAIEQERIMREQKREEANTEEIRQIIDQLSVEALGFAIESINNHKPNSPSFSSFSS